MCHCKYDYFVELKNEYLYSDYFSKSKFLRNASKHLISTLLSSDKIKNLRNKNFSTIIFNVEDLKSNAYKNYKKRNFKDAIHCYMNVS